MNKWEQRYIKQLQVASNAIKSAQDILIENGLDVRQPKVKIDKWSKIQIPKGHIRTAKNFMDKYNLSEILCDSNLQKNIAYSLQTSDFLNFIHNRFHVDLSVGSIFYKLSIIHIFCVVEAILYGIVHNLHSHCVSNDFVVCTNNRGCKFYIKSTKKIKLNGVVDLLTEKQVLNLELEDRNLLLKYNNMRNNVHIFINKNNEFLTKQYNRETYNRIIVILGRISKNLRNNLETFRKERSITCGR